MPGTGLTAASVLGLNSAWRNTVTLVVPVVSAAFGPDGLKLLLPILSLQTIILLPLATVLIAAEAAPAGTGPLAAASAGMVVAGTVLSVLTLSLFLAIGCYSRVPHELARTPWVRTRALGRAPSNYSGRLEARTIAVRRSNTATKSKNL